LRIKTVITGFDENEETHKEKRGPQPTGVEWIIFCYVASNSSFAAHELALLFLFLNCLFQFASRLHLVRNQTVVQRGSHRILTRLVESVGFHNQHALHNHHCAQTHRVHHSSKRNENGQRDVQVEPGKMGPMGSDLDQ